MKVLFVCLGNICRSPTAEGVFRRALERAGLADEVEIDSCGVGSWHLGKAPDARAQQAALLRGIDISDLHARFYPIRLRARHGSGQFTRHARAEACQ
mgnify:CR=1 FL=1